jgi:hypothetical protein
MAADQITETDVPFEAPRLEGVITHTARYVPWRL